MEMQENQLAALLIFAIGSFGFICNFTVVFFLRKSKSLANSFGILTLNQAVTDLINSTIFTFIVAPIIYFSISAPFNLTARLGQLLFLSYDCCSWSHLTITINRFLSIYAPLKYQYIFSKRKTKCYVAVMWTLAICVNFFEYVSVDCAFWLPNGHWNFDFKGGRSCQLIEWYLNYCRGMFLTAIIAVMDMTTLVRFHRLNAKMFDVGTKSKRTPEFFFLAQAMLQSLLFYIELVCCYNIGALPFMAGPWAQFGLRTVAWITIHALDGLITLICNGDMRRILAQLICGRKVPQIKVSESSRNNSVFTRRMTMVYSP